MPGGRKRGYHGDIEPLVEAFVPATRTNTWLSYPEEKQSKPKTSEIAKLTSPTTGFRCVP